MKIVKIEIEKIMKTGREIPCFHVIFSLFPVSYRASRFFPVFNIYTFFPVLSRFSLFFPCLFLFFSLFFWDILCFSPVFPFLVFSRFFPCREKTGKSKKNFDSLFSRGYVGKVPKNGKIKVLGTFPMGTLDKYLKIKKK